MLKTWTLGLLLLAAACTPADPSAPAAGEPAEPRAEEAAGRWVLTDAAVPATLAAGASGRVYAAYARGGHAHVRWLDGGTLSAPHLVNPDAEDVAVHGQAPAQVAVLPDGTVLVAYVRQIPVEGRRFPASQIRLGRSTDGGRTFSVHTVSEDVGYLTGNHFHDLAVAGDGTVYLSWLDGRARDAARQAGGAAPVRPVALEVARGAHGHGAPTRLARHEPGTELRVARSTDGGQTFAPSVIVAKGTCECCRTALAVAPGGDVFVAWRHQFQPDVRDVALARSTDRGATFSPPARLPGPAWSIKGCPHTGPAVAAPSDGVVEVAWFTGAEGEAGVYRAHSTDGGQTFAETLVEPSAIIRQVHLGVQDGRTLLAWEHAGGTHLGTLDVRGGLAPLADLHGSGPDLAVTPGAVWSVARGADTTYVVRQAF